jgi:hypothetical protein
MIGKGTILRTKTKTQGDTFGTVMWEVLETGLQAPEKGREHMRDGVKVIMLGGSGVSARAGLTLIDSEENINKDIASGVSVIVPPEKRDSMLLQVGRKVDAAKMPKHGGTGVIEV